MDRDRRETELTKVTRDKEKLVTRSSIRLGFLAVVALLVASPAAAQDDDPAVLNLAQPDFSLVSLPTSLRTPTMKGAFRVTHRFGRPLGEGDFQSLVEDAFGLDSGAVIGLEYRFGIWRNTEIGIHRTNFDKTISFFGQYSIMHQPSSPLDVSALVSIDGTNNFKDSYSPAIGAIVSRQFADFGALYVEPVWVNNSNALPSALVDDNDTVILGLGARVRIRPSVYIVGEFAPRVAGYDPGAHHGSFAIEKRAGGHLFQLNFSNSFATTMGHLARGGTSSEDWYLGFNISRKFF
jgi:hypothetical protein